MLWPPLTAGKYTPVYIPLEGGWTKVPIRTLWEKKLSLILGGTEEQLIYSALKPLGRHYTE
jgi:hypothetical protein